MKLGYVVLYVDDAQASRDFWINRIGMVEKGSQQAGPFSIVKVGFPDQEFSFELVPLELMKNNPDNLDLATPSIAFYVPDLSEIHQRLSAQAVQVSEIGEHSGITSFAFSDNEGRWFAVLQS